MLLHDFPEFLCDYHYGFCDVIPPNCIQMRNLILSAFPRNMRLPDPFTPNLKVDMLQEISHAPRVLTNFATLIQPPTFRKELDSYLKARAPVTFLGDLRTNLQVVYIVCFISYTTYFLRIYTNKHDIIGSFQVIIVIIMYIVFLSCCYL